MLQSLSALALASGITQETAASEMVSSLQTRRVKLDRKFLLFPINNDAAPRRVRMVKNGRVLRSFTASLGLPADWWAHLDVTEWQRQTVSLSIGPDESPAVLGIKKTSRGLNETDNPKL